MKRLLFLLPVLLFAGIAAAAFLGLRSGDPSDLPSALIDRPAPEFALPPLPGADRGFSSSDLGGAPVLVNVFASWCVPCLAEHPLLTRLAEDRDVPIYAINYKDAPEDALAWLARHGNPYTLIGSDLDGRVGIDWGVYGVPETFVIDGEGRIRYRHAGPLTPELVDGEILPLLAELRS
ncbi:MAG TPA: DsbE family thiol:disulfide interchange protein [Alphaproteobacteria bacterium]|nr:DsbE family thiol:disulfide interchange protein [Alphaproteobacteria bacterium]